MTRPTYDYDEETTTHWQGTSSELMGALRQEGQNVVWSAQISKYPLMLKPLTTNCQGHAYGGKEENIGYYWDMCCCTSIHWRYLIYGTGPRLPLHAHLNFVVMVLPACTPAAPTSTPLASVPATGTSTFRQRKLTTDTTSVSNVLFIKSGNVIDPDAARVVSAHVQVKTVGVWCQLSLRTTDLMVLSKTISCLPHEVPLDSHYRHHDNDIMTRITYTLSVMTI
ncbi:hypothetical protein BDN67DRAFT_985832 [Paxillus ammoniavirescens]|nr:hypothetical protein BDN67DRAFT_985832 [Paxillus ammoniavirescens]